MGFALTMLCNWRPPWSSTVGVGHVASAPSPSSPPIESSTPPPQRKAYRSRIRIPILEPPTGIRYGPLGQPVTLGRSLPREVAKCELLSCPGDDRQSTPLISPRRAVERRDDRGRRDVRVRPSGGNHGSGRL